VYGHGMPCPYEDEDVQRIVGIMEYRPLRPGSTIFFIICKSPFTRRKKWCIFVLIRKDGRYD